MASSSQPFSSEEAPATAGRFNLADELVACREESEYRIPNEVNISDLDSGSERTQLLDSLIDSLSLSPSSIDSDDTFDLARSLLKYFASLNGVHRSKLVDAFSSAYSIQLDAATRDLELDGIERYKEHAETLEKYAFLLQWLIHAAERASNSREERAAAQANGTAGGSGAAKGRRKTTKKGAMPMLTTATPIEASKNLAGWDWQQSTPQILSLLLKSLRLSTSILFPLSASRDAFVSGCVLRPCLLLQENEAHLKVQSIKLGIFKVISSAVKNHGQAFAVQTSIMQALAYYEHLAEPMAELLTLLRIEFDYERLGDDVLREVAAREFGGLDTKSPRSFARFLVRMGELSPRSVLRTISLLLKHLDSESYPMRNAILEILGILIRELTTTDDALPGAEAGSLDVDDGRHRPSAATAANGAGGNDGNVDEQRGSTEARKRQVEQFWSLIMERFLDLNSYVRCKCISVCSKLCELPAKFPTQRNQLVELSIQALGDKSSSARKNAIALITKLILTHPFGLMHGGELDRDEWNKRLEAVDDELKVFDGLLDVPMDDDEAQTEDEDNDGEDEGDADKTPRKNKPRRSVDLQALAAQQSKLSPVEAEKLVRLRLTRRYYVDALTFIEQLAAAIPILSLLLVSTNKAEALESMECFRVAHEYRVPGSVAGIKKMVHLIWTKDNTLVMEDGQQLKGIRSRLIEVYRSLYFEPVADLSPRDNVTRIARNMIERTFGATLAELTSLEELFSTMCTEGFIHDDIVTKLWSVYTAKQPIPASQRQGAIIVLSMLAVAKREIVSENIDDLLQIGLGRLGAKDIVLAKYTCIALGRVGGSVKKVKGALSDEQLRFPMNHRMFSRLCGAIQWPSMSGEWFSLAENAIQTIYLLGEQPDALCADLIKTMAAKLFGPSGPMIKAGGEAASVPPTPAPYVTPATPGSMDRQALAFSMAQLVFVVGHVALKESVYLELVEREYKRRKAVADEQKRLRKKDTNRNASDNADEAEATSKGSKENSAAAASRKASASRKAKGSKDSDNSGVGADELDQVAGNAEDEIGEVVAEVREKELLFGERSLLAVFGPMISHICSNPKSYPNEFLRRASVLSLCKLMCVSSSFCESNLPLVFSILSTSEDPVVRSNIVIGLGDMAISFGNLIDENSEKLYAGLTDKDLGVKKHTLMVLTHLILNGMIKVKGQLGEMAKCLEDDDERVSDLAKLFFTELATKENAVYNNLPDIISHLSIGKHAVDEATFEKIMRFVFTFIDKEKQAENVVEKLCQRFRLTSEERQWRDIAYCLSLLPYKSDRSVKRLIENLAFYQDKLHDATVFKRFSEILAKARGNRAAGGASAAAAAAAAAVGGGSSNENELQEFEQILEQARAHGVNDVELESAAKAKLDKARQQRRRKASSQAGYRSTSGSSMASTASLSATTRSTRKNGGRSASIAPIEE